MKGTPAFKFGQFEIYVETWNQTITPLSAEEAEAKLHREGYECFHWYDVPGANYPQHQHQYDECLWLLKGELLIKTHEQLISLKAGDKIYLPAKLPHDLSVPTHSSATYLVGQKKTPSQSKKKE